MKNIKTRPTSMLNKLNLFLECYQKIKQKKILKIVNCLAIILLVSKGHAQQAGSLDTSFNPGTANIGNVTSVSLRPDGKINILHYDSNNSCSLGYCNANGTYSGSFLSNSLEKTGVFQPDGKWISGGDFNVISGTVRHKIARFNTNGSVDATFNPAGADNTVSSIILQPNGKIVIKGAFTTYDGIARNGIARLNANGSLDTTFDVAQLYLFENRNIIKLILLPDGKFLILERIQSLSNNQAQCRIGRLNSNGSDDTSFTEGIAVGNSQAIDQLTAALQPDGKIIIGGGFSSYNGTPRNGITRVNADGSIDTSFNPGTGTFLVLTTTLQPDGKIIIGGYFNAYNGTARNSIARINSNGTIDTTFDPGTGISISYNGILCSVYTSVLQPDGKIIIGGYFASYDGTIRKGIARINGGTALANAVFKKNEMVLYPNPTKNILNISFNDGILLNNVAIVDITGKVVLEQTENLSTINVENLAKGVYILTAYAGDEKYQEKFIKE